MIREGVKRGIERRKEIGPYKLQRPVKLQLAFKDVVDAEIISFLPGVERLNGTIVLFTARDMIEAVRFVEGALHPIQ